MSAKNLYLINNVLLVNLQYVLKKQSLGQNDKIEKMQIQGRESATNYKGWMIQWGIQWGN